MKRVLSVVVLLLATGCTSTELQRSTVAHGATVSTIVAEMALDNLAAFYTDKNALPWMMKLTGGQIVVNDSIGAGFTIAWPHISRFGNAHGDRQWQMSWMVVPEMDTTALRKIKARYLKEVNATDFAASYEISSTPFIDGPSGNYGLTWVRARPGSDKLSILLDDILTTAPVTAQDRGLMLSVPSPTIRQ